MSTEVTRPEALPAPEPDLDEASLISSLARLQEMHASLRNLRCTIPRLIDSVLVAPPQPDLLHSHFTTAATTAAREIRNFSLLMDQPRNKDALEKARGSRARDNEGVRAWLVAEHGDWLDVKKEESSDDMDIIELEGEVKTPPDGTKSDTAKVNAALEKFRTAHRGIATAYNVDEDQIKVELPSPANITFLIDPTTGGESTSYTVRTAKETKFLRPILEAIASRARPNDLNFLLELLASYMDVKSNACTKCSRLVDRNGVLPTIRSRKQIKQNGDTYSTQWLAYHESCV
ncbi:hypothetical protein MMC21_005482 [Puttea exsequens]|nr:hypothetical protein [Puttea exsequens]